MRTSNLLLSGALAALAVVGVVAAQQASPSGSASDSSTGDGSLPADVPAHAGHNCPLHDKAAASSGSGSASSSDSSSAA